MLRKVSEFSQQRKLRPWIMIFHLGFSVKLFRGLPSVLIVDTWQKQYYANILLIPIDSDDAVVILHLCAPRALSFPVASAIICPRSNEKHSDARPHRWCKSRVIRWKTMSRLREAIVRAIAVAPIEGKIYDDRDLSVTVRRASPRKLQVSTNGRRN